jgi:hypothetical protein
MPVVKFTTVGSSHKKKVLQFSFVMMQPGYELDELQIYSMYVEQVQSYKYLGSVVNSDNSI